ncbi:pyrroline-5-carboxylate reductase [Streptomyces armeniacus]|uniref:Pyrroline-5-carboxylate reductase n=1 Tax=Streptomyces armeniacus TaxID=83291 RepID=A0A345XVF0_9ACTN|nr:NAD(P)-binding domain-containing protein [Streptomyces armeniacus]AXK35616.1 pyrroline-5-carboxylate reductase [Streptomyces armeniacus]
MPPQSSSSSSSFGFVGAGEITAALVAGMSAEAGAPPAVFLSPRGRTVARDLSDRFPNVRVCRSNQEVVDSTTSIVLAVPPPAAQSVLEELSFGPEHVVLSAVAGLRLDRLAGWAAPAGQVVRTIPLPQAAHRESLTVAYPDHAVARDLFDRVGGMLVPDDERALEAFSATTATFAAHLDYLATVAAWLADRGVDHATATDYTTHIFSQLGRSLSEHDDALAVMTGKHSTPGGTNEQLRNDLRRDGVPDSVRHALDRVLSRLRS